MKLRICQILNISQHSNTVKRIESSREQNACRDGEFGGAGASKKSYY
jgi:hypothetical protein